jgi:hypothetical protein
MVLGASFGEDDGVTLVEDGGWWEGPVPCVGAGPWWSGWRCGGYVVVVADRGLFGGDLGDGGAGGGVVDDGLVGGVGGDEGLQRQVVDRSG